MIEIPDDAIARVDSKGKLTKPEYAEIYNEINANRKTLKSELFAAEWNICAGVLGNTAGFSRGVGLGYAGFKARAYQSMFLSAQLGKKEALAGLADLFEYSTYLVGLYKNLQMAKEFRKVASNPPLDEYGMMPYLDEIVGNYFVMDFNRGGIVINPTGSMHRVLRELVEDKGELLDPRDFDANETTREKFVSYVKKELPEYAEIFSEKGYPANYEDRDIDLYIDSTLLESKIMSLTPPEGYPNAPYYNTPEELTRLYEAGKLDKKLNPLTPVMYRDSFPEDLRQKILSYAKEHNIKD